MFSLRRDKGYKILSDTNEVVVADRKVKVTPKEMGVLELLQSKNGVTVSRTELLETVWGDKFANDQGLTQAISRLRGILSPCNGVRILTIPKKGYQLQAPLFDVNEVSPSRRRMSNPIAVIVLLLILTLCLVVYLRPIRIRIQKSYIGDPQGVGMQISESSIARSR